MASPNFDAFALTRPMASPAMPKFRDIQNTFTNATSLTTAGNPTFTLSLTSIAMDDSFYAWHAGWLLLPVSCTATATMAYHLTSIST